MNTPLIPDERIESKIFLIRGLKVMLDSDLAMLYRVQTMVLNQAVRRNADRFPDDFMFRLTNTEFQILISQSVISRSTHGGRRHAPLVFTEQGVAMLSSVLNSKRAIIVNIQIMRTFTKLREMILENDQLRLKLEDFERRYDEQFQIVFDALRRLLAEPDQPKTQIGFKTDGGI